MSKRGPVRIPLDFSEIEFVAVSWSNYFLLQYDHGEFVLTVAQVSPPVLLGDDQAERAKSLESVAVRPVARVVVSRAKLQALADIIRQQLEKFPPDLTNEGESKE